MKTKSKLYAYIRRGSGSVATLPPVVKNSCRSGIGVIAAILIMRLLLVLPANAQESGSRDDISRAIRDIEVAGTFSQMQMAINNHETVWKDPNTVAVLNSILVNPSVGSDIRFHLQVERELALDCQRYGTQIAARLLSVRILAVAAVTARSVGQIGRAHV